MLVNSRLHREEWPERTSSGSEHKREEKNWTALWKIQVPSNIRVFLWRLAKQSIPIGDIRFRQNMVNDSACSLCGREDFRRHSLLGCNMSRCVWALVPERITEHMMQTSETNAKLWIFTMINTLHHDDLIRCLVTLYGQFGLLAGKQFTRRYFWACCPLTHL
jgi:hypothetical protein